MLKNIDYMKNITYDHNIIKDIIPDDSDVNTNIPGKYEIKYIIIPQNTSYAITTITKQVTVVAYYKPILISGVIL